ncbi:MAG: carbohydrate ABC transporter permease [Chloroflexi bacterium]|jgi:multiple sugar transport system permease protein|nr:carbohydrate ABC transporter permease [Chloroflexota bacterium]MBV6437434.1 Trehalose transport system permease protein SugB [Anaerolineae bacterium]MDL1914645.1 carbohydrate ABC transporter permease [Anaerolineae bacterium CFX4]OQY84248.1 MAG: ABC transporter permease [Anaerolineae bacterium UTCFX5]MCC6566037.1 carbohydrate ABC transporter permease [Chloroflexota bacterium]
MKSPMQRVLLTGFTVILAVFFVTPLLWFVFAPFNPQASLSVTIPQSPSLANFEEVLSNEMAMRGLLQNSVIIGIGTMVGTSLIAALAAYGISRGTLPGRKILTYVLILFSSVVSGTASMVPIFKLIYDLGLIDTHIGVILVMIGGSIPSAIFIMQDFVESVPRSYEEAAMVAGASPLQIFRDVTFPVMRPGVLVVGIWVLVGAWGSFLTPFILLRNIKLMPASVTFFLFYDLESGMPQIRLISAYAVLYTIPVLLLYLLINWRYGFRFFGGIKQ